MFTQIEGRYLSRFLTLYLCVCVCVSLSLPLSCLLLPTVVAPRLPNLLLLLLLLLQLQSVLPII